MGALCCMNSAEKITYLQLFVRQVFTQLLGNSLQVFKGDFARAVIIKQPEGFQDLLFGILFTLVDERELCDEINDMMGRRRAENMT